MGYEYRTFAVVRMLSTGTLATRLCSLWLYRYDGQCTEGCTSLLMSKSTNRLNATVFSFAPDVISPSTPLSSEPSAVSAGIGLVLNFWDQFVLNFWDQFVLRFIGLLKEEHSMFFVLGSVVSLLVTAPPMAPRIECFIWKCKRLSVS